MKKYLVQINEATIKENENAGDTPSYFPGLKRISFKADVLPDILIDGENCRITRWQVDDCNGKKYNVEGELIGAVTVEDMRAYQSKGVIFSYEQEITTIGHLPIPKYSYGYKNIPITCGYCKAEMMLCDLETVEDFEGYIISEKACPKCGETDCVDLKYESIEAAIKRAGIKTSKP